MKSHTTNTLLGGDLMDIDDRDREKVGNMVRKRYSTRFSPSVYIGNNHEPALPPNSSNLIGESIENQGQTSPKNNDPYILNANSQTDPETYRNQRKLANSRSSGHSTSGLNVDIDTLKLKDININHFVSNETCRLTTAEIDQFVEKLSTLYTRSQEDNQARIEKNFSSFLVVQNEIQELSDRLKGLRSLIQELHYTNDSLLSDAKIVIANEESQKSTTLSSSISTNNLLNVPSSLDVSKGGASRANNRNSIMILENIWADRLTSLFKEVEGAQKYLPVVQGRHLVFESDEWSQLNSATWKHLQTVRLYLLNDHLLIATRKRRGYGNELSIPSSSGSQKLFAEKCWALKNIELTDLNSRSTASEKQQLLPQKAIPGAVSIKYGESLYVYQTEDSIKCLEFMKLFREFQDVSRVLSGKSVALEQGSESTFRESRRVSPESTALHGRSNSVDITGRSRTLREFDDTIHKIDVMIAHRNFDEAVKILNENDVKLKQISDKLDAIANKGIGEPTADEHPLLVLAPLKAKFLQRKEDLVELLATEIVSSDKPSSLITRRDLQNYVRCLVDLGKGVRARKEFFKSRRNLIEKRARNIELQGDVPLYITQIAAIYFKTIKTVITIHNNCLSTFSNSALIEWIKEIVDDYIVIFSRQLYSIDANSQTYQICTEITRREAECVKEVGVDIGFLLALIYDP
ncbi:hypothetical protein NADFUDRAFT_83564 [Nadsonia fulvescens var. elongata DSM 6958]|uniref:Exocyst complex component EXO84 n=1 Tax=Nadsonia fulvescens var. elongata DSM 6958 TaxID=857566 RepID=A0A1E3PGT6_9ASCO|nr:hypothetical protein NADFUDRAFT_83564 [Nadsonia fulvescens var. elongata DSM 6958]